MTLLQVMPEDRPEVVELRTRDEQVIADALRPIGVDYFHWELQDLPAGATPADFLAAYQEQVDALSAEGGYTVVDAVGLRPADTEEYREKSVKARGSFLSEHRHAEDEVRFFAAGRGCFYLHVDGKVMAVVCEAGDLISVPAGTTHWFDMGEQPDFVAIRWFQEADGWVGDFTGAPIASSFPTLDELLA
ncbi:cupin domain-containing protein [Pseudonocardiaceae bacterium YIM PH 21723]|nr:cupin domain-containing protein [Pseudonocardiaceae bacterium YIM PH 21723]